MSRRGADPASPTVFERELADTLEGVRRSRRRQRPPEDVWLEDAALRVADAEGGPELFEHLLALLPEESTVALPAHALFVADTVLLHRARHAANAARAAARRVVAEAGGTGAILEHDLRSSLAAAASNGRPAER